MSITFTNTPEYVLCLCQVILKLFFYQENDSKHEEVHYVENIYCDQLKDIFELETNLLVTFNQRRNSSVRVEGGGFFGKLVRG